MVIDICYATASGYWMQLVVFGFGVLMMIDLFVTTTARFFSLCVLLLRGRISNF
jgi:hypothetical protein